MDPLMKELAEVRDAVVAKGAEMVEAVNQQRAETVELGKATKEVETRLSALGNDNTQLRARLLEIEQKMTRRVMGNSEDAPKTWGETLTASDRLSAMREGKASSARVSVSRDAPRMEQKAILNLGTTVAPVRQSLVPLAQRRMTIRDLLPSIPVVGNAVEFVRQSAFTNAAAPVAENTAKPYSDNTFTLVNLPIRTIAHLQKVSRQSLDDLPQLRAFIDNMMRYGLAYAEEAQILSGAGTGQNLSGLTTNATAYATSRNVSGDRHADVLAHAISQVEDAGYAATGVVISPTDWWKIRLTKDTSGGYIAGGPFGSDSPSIWGIDVIASPAIAAGSFLVGAFAQAAVIYDRMEAEVLVSTENADDFEKNMATVRAESRLAVAVTLPTGLVTGSFPTIPVP